MRFARRPALAANDTKGEKPGFSPFFFVDPKFQHLPRRRLGAVAATPQAPVSGWMLKQVQHDERVRSR
jgi:hypothetical protein